jgi:Type I phosphodiesterase / nucleotide pyrophosphatase
MAATNWHLGMVGHGASYPGGDHDPAVLISHDGATYSNDAFYSLPVSGDAALLAEETQALDRADGRDDGAWRGHPLDDPSVRFAGPAEVAYEQALLERLITTTGLGDDRVPDLLYVNFKASDDAGHRWGMTSPEVGEVVGAQDDALARLVRFLDRTVGRGEWVVMVTADHGQTPYPQETGAWPIGGGELKRDANEVFDRNDDGIDLVDRVSSPGAYVRSSQLRANDVTLERVARWMTGYTARENFKGRGPLPRWYRGAPSDPLFDAVMARRRVVARSCRP